jgi:glycosyltransferase 2 family protein
LNKLILGVFISFILLYFSFKDVKYEEIILSFENVDYFFLFLTMGCFVLQEFLISLRWGVILSPLHKFRQNLLFPLTAIGIMAITLTPMRLGEFLRPYLVSTKSQISLTSAVASVFVERLLEILSLLVLLFVVMHFSNLPPWVLQVGYTLLIIVIGLLLGVYLLYFRKEAVLLFLDPIISKFPKKIQTGIERLSQQFIEGCKIIEDPTKLFLVFLLSAFIWGFSVVGIYSLFHFQNLELSWVSAAVVLIFTLISILMPSAPGFIGNFQFGCIMALSMYGLPKSDAAAFSLIYYVLTIVVNIGLGAVCLPFLNISIKDTFERIKKLQDNHAL